MVCACVNQMQVQMAEITKIDMIDTIKVIERQDDNHIWGWQPPTYDDEGVKNNATWQNVAMIAVAVLNTVTAIQIARKQYKIAKEYLDLAKERWRRFKNVYMPWEKVELAEAGNTPKYDKKYYEQSNKYRNNINTVFSTSINDMMNIAKGLSLCIDPSVSSKLFLEKSKAVIDGVEFALRHEEHLQLLHDDIRFNRRAASLNRGRDLLADSATAAAKASDAYGNMADAIAQGAQGAIRGIGYFANRNPTEYPVGINGITGYHVADKAATNSSLLANATTYGAATHVNNFNNANQPDKNQTSA